LRPFQISIEPGEKTLNKTIHVSEKWRKGEYLLIAHLSKKGITYYEDFCTVTIG